MKKLKLDKLQLQKEDFLTREQLKGVFGGFDGSTNKAGISCTIRYADADNIIIDYTSPCEFVSMTQCSIHAMDKCVADAAAVNGSCIAVMCQ